MSEHRYFLDTNIFSRLTVKDVPAMAADCKVLLSAIGTGQANACTSSLVLAEVSWLLQSFYKLSKADVLEVLQGIVGIQNLYITDQTNAVVALTYYERYKIKFVDCLIASHPDIQSGKLVVVSYDKDFDKLGVTRFEPRDVLKIDPLEKTSFRNFSVFLLLDPSVNARFSEAPHPTYFKGWYFFTDGQIG